MGISLGNDAGSLWLRAMDWCGYLTIMQNHGWDPQGTELDRSVEITATGEAAAFRWDGSYGSNDGQIVVESDAAAMAIAMRLYIDKLDLCERVIDEAGGREMFESPVIAALEALFEAERRAKGITLAFDEDDDDDIGLDVGLAQREADVEIASLHLQRLLEPLRAKGDGLEEYTDRGLAWMLIDGRPESRSMFAEFLAICDGGAFMIC